VTDVEGITIHFVGLFSEKKDAVPLLLLHGWPGKTNSGFGLRETNVEETNLPDYRKLFGVSAYIAKVPRRVYPRDFALSLDCAFFTGLRFFVWSPVGQRFRNR
jgi:hypothetical protein